MKTSLKTHWYWKIFLLTFLFSLSSFFFFSVFLYLCLVVLCMSILLNSVSFLTCTILFLPSILPFSQFLFCIAFSLILFVFVSVTNLLLHTTSHKTVWPCTVTSNSHKYLLSTHKNTQQLTQQCPIHARAILQSQFFPQLPFPQHNPTTLGTVSIRRSPDHPPLTDEWNQR